MSPILANIYLDRLDKYVTGTLIPQHTRGERRKPNREYARKKEKARYLGKTGRREEAAVLWKEVRNMPSIQTDDPEYRRLRYVRYADDFLLGFIGTHEEAQNIKAQLAAMLQNSLKLDLSEEKTLVTHARTGQARFLGYNVSIATDDTQRNARGRYVNGIVTLSVPQEVVQEACRRYMSNGKPIHRAERLNNEVFTIIADYQTEYRGLVEYYRMAHNLRDLSVLKWTMETSLTKTLASKLKTSVAGIYRRYHATVENEHGRPYKALQVRVEREGKRPLVATWGGISLARKTNAALNDNPYQVPRGRTELVKRLLADECELCGSTEQVQVHHIRKLADLKKHGRTLPMWAQTMVARQRKTLVVCHECHQAIHAGKPTRRKMGSPGEPDDAKVSSPVRRGADGKVSA